MSRCFVLLVVVGGVIGCSDPPAEAPACIELAIDPATCTPAYVAPTYTELFTRTIQPTCGKPGFACHSLPGKQSGLDFNDIDGSYAALFEPARVRAGDPRCSILVHRVVATDGRVRMPPGRSISAEEQCTIVKWIADGAKR